jgi:hypothetical protein
MKSTYTVSIETKTLQEFYDKTHKQGVVKSAIIQQLISEYLEYGLREYPSTSLPKTTHPIDKNGVNV